MGSPTRRTNLISYQLLNKPVFVRVSTSRLGKSLDVLDDRIRVSASSYAFSFEGL